LLKLQNHQPVAVIASRLRYFKKSGLLRGEAISTFNNCRDCFTTLAPLSRLSILYVVRSDGECVLFFVIALSAGDIYKSKDFWWVYFKLSQSKHIILFYGLYIDARKHLRYNIHADNSIKTFSLSRNIHKSGAFQFFAWD
jgi:hypothetical protein